ncbi:MAG: tryptophan--tRNA ligase, partial [Actinomycetota bacterium]
AEAAWLLGSVTSFGELRRMVQFKEKADQQEFVSSGLFTYPVLQAADILLYRTDEVPVGEDQRQHVELSREIARRFNATYSEVLVEPAHVIPEVGARIMDLQNPENKMSTTGGSEHGTVYVLDEPETIVKKFKSAVTDSGREVVRGPDKAGITNLIDILAAVRGVEPEQIEKEYASAEGYAKFKQDVGDAVAEHLAPVRERYSQLREDHGALEGILSAGAEKARAISSETLALVRERMGVGPPSA